MVKKLILFGRSPFINQVDVSALLHHQTVGFNNFATHHPIDYSFCLNKYFTPFSPKTKTFAHWEIEAPECAEKIAVRGSETPFLANEERDGFPCYARCASSVTTAINMIIRRKMAKEIYLVGVDHVETDKRFEHHDGAHDERGQNMSPEIHRMVKKFIGECAQYVKIFQCNHHVKNDWSLPYYDLQQLY